MTSAEAIALVEAARGPDDLFGADAARAYRRLAQLTHPDTCPGDSRAARAFAKLATLWRQHQDGHGVLVARGDIANLYRVRDGLLKLARDPAAHNVVTTDGRHHTFAQFGSGTFTPGVRTHLSRFMLVDPLALAAEATHLASAGAGDALDRLTVNRDALLTTPYHRAANRARGVARHGSCGAGIGETARYALEYPGDAPRVADCSAPQALARSLRRLRDRLADELGPLEAPPVADVCDAYRAFADRVTLVDGGYLDRLLRTGPVVFEGAQGVLLDEWRGFHPYTTWSTTTFANAETLLAEAGDTALRLGVVRCYLTRHGPGPFVTEDPTLELPEPHTDWPGLVEGALGTPVALTSYGPTAADKRAEAPTQAIRW